VQLCESKINQVRYGREPNGTHFVAKVVKTFGTLQLIAETLDEFRYHQMPKVSDIGREPRCDAA
jgi:hypothetical protein